MDVVDRARRRYRHRFLKLELTPLPRDAAFVLASGAAGAQLPETVAALLAEARGVTRSSSRRRSATSWNEVFCAARTAGSSSRARPKTWPSPLSSRRPCKL